MNRRQSNTLRSRAALAAMLSLATFIVCLTGLAVVSSRDSRSDRQEEFRSYVRPYLPKLSQTTEAASRQRTLQEMVTGEPRRVAAAVVVSTDMIIEAALPGRVELVGKSVRDTPGSDEEKSPDTVGDVMPPRAPRAPSAWLEPEEPPQVSEAPSAASRAARERRRARSRPRGEWPDSSTMMKYNLRELMADSAAIGSLARESDLIREPLIDKNGNDIGWLFVLPHPRRSSSGVGEAVEPLLGITMGFSFMLYSFMLPLWVYADARTRTAKAVPLALFVFFTNFLGWLTYLVIRPESDRLCPSCEANIDPGFRLCPHCGWSDTLRCHQCGRPAQADWRFCPFCETARPDVELQQELAHSARP